MSYQRYMYLLNGSFKLSFMLLRVNIKSSTLIVGLFLETVKSQSAESVG